MPQDTPPTFDQWIEYCFLLGYRDFNGTSGVAQQTAWDRESRFSMGPVTLTRYLTRLFESPGFIAERFTDDQIGDGVWYIFGCATEYFHDVRSETVPTGEQIACISAVATMYADLFDRVCGRHGQDPDEDLSDTLTVDTAVFMIWDMGSVEGSLYAPALTDTAYGVLEAVLTKSLTSTCQKSALHGLGEVCKGSGENCERARSLIDMFLTKRHPPDWLRNYAIAAREGSVL